MATGIRKMIEEVTCSICLQLMTSPVTIDCGHNFCYVCIENICQNEVPPTMHHARCPLCQASFQRRSLKLNRLLKNLIETIKYMESERLCEEHEEKLQLFCEDDGQLICWRCERSPQHKGHNVDLLEDVCPRYKEKLQEIVTKLKNVQDLCENAKLFARKQITEWKENVEFQSKKIQFDFRNLHNFLHEEEKRYLWKLENEKEQMLSRLQDDEASLEKQSLELERLIQQLEEKCQGSAQNLLQDVKDIIKRNVDVKPELPEKLSLQLQTACNVSELYFDIKKIFKSCQVSVTLDPDTAHPELIVSMDQKHVNHGTPQLKYPNIRRFTMLPRVLGCEGFTSESHYFEVGVGKESGWNMGAESGWDIGVCLENVQRNSSTISEPQSGFWAIRSCPMNGFMALTSPPTFLPRSEQVRVVGVFLDCEAGLVSFYNITSGSYIFTFPKASFSDTLRPYLQVYNFSSLFLPSSLVPV